MSTRDLHRVYRQIQLLLTHQEAEHEAEAARQKAQVPRRVNNPLFVLLIGKITIYALNKLHNELRRSQKSDFLAMSPMAFTQVMGLLCAHILTEQLQIGWNIHPLHIHQHWFFDPHTALEHFQILLDPVLRDHLSKSTRGSLTQSKNTGQRPLITEVSDGPERVMTLRSRQPVSSTRRDPSGYELIGIVT